MSGPSPHHHLSHHTHHSHPAIVTPGVRQDLHTDSNHRYLVLFFILSLKNGNKVEYTFKLPKGRGFVGWISSLIAVVSRYRGS